MSMSVTPDSESGSAPLEPIIQKPETVTPAADSAGATAPSPQTPGVLRSESSNRLPAETPATLNDLEGQIDFESMGLSMTVLGQVKAKAAEANKTVPTIDAVLQLNAQLKAVEGPLTPGIHENAEGERLQGDPPCIPFVERAVAGLVCLVQMLGTMRLALARTMVAAVWLALIAEDELFLAFRSDGGDGRIAGEPLYPNMTAFGAAVLRAAGLGDSATRVSRLLNIGRLALTFRGAKLPLPSAPDRLEPLLRFPPQKAMDLYVDAAKAPDAKAGVPSRASLLSEIERERGKRPKKLTAAQKWKGALHACYLALVSAKSSQDWSLVDGVVTTMHQTLEPPPKVKKGSAKGATRAASKSGKRKMAPKIEPRPQAVATDSSTDAAPADPAEPVSVDSPIAPPGSEQTPAGGATPPEVIVHELPQSPEILDQRTIGLVVVVLQPQEIQVRFSDFDSVNMGPVRDYLRSAPFRWRPHQPFVLDPEQKGVWVKQIDSAEKCRAVFAALCAHVQRMYDEVKGSAGEEA